MNNSLQAYLRSGGYTIQSLSTFSYWKYALLTWDSLKSFLSAFGAMWLIIESFDYFSIWNREDFPGYTKWIILLISLVWVIRTRRPLTKISYRIPGKDLTIEVRITDIFKIEGQKVIGTNSTFDTDLSNNIIAAKSIQGQFTNIYYPQSVNKLDSDITQALNGIQFTLVNKPHGKKQKYEYGTTVSLQHGLERFYLLAMADLNEQNVTVTTHQIVMLSINKFWEYMGSSGGKDTIVMPLMGTNYGRITASRKKMISQIAESFISASEVKRFSNKLVIAIYPGDVRNFGINLFDIKDMLIHNLH